MSRWNAVQYTVLFIGVGQTLLIILVILINCADSNEMKSKWMTATHTTEL